VNDVKVNKFLDLYLYSILSFEWMQETTNL